MGDTRGSSSLFRRAEQLRRWQESETNKTEIKTRNRKVTFSDGCIFLAAGAAGDRDELLRLLQKGADINTVNQDGITALHAACIDNNMEIVEFLVDHGADINRCDMEGWTPLHATASCGSCTMAKFLIDRGADLALVNNDGELPIDVVDDDDMARLLQLEMKIRNIDCDASRSREERLMLSDVQTWIKNSYYADVPHPNTGASALHVASAKGYIKVLRLLIEAGADINLIDVDGWTPLHAAAHWGQSEAVELLCDNLANMEAVNYVGQTPIDLSEESMKPLMDELRRRQEKLKLRNKTTNKPVKRRKSPQGERPVKKEKDTQSDGTSSDESTTDDKIQSTPPETRNNTTVDDKEIQSWRRASSLRNKIHHEDKNQKEEVNRTTSTPSRLSNKENEEITTKRGSVLGKDDSCMTTSSERLKARSCPTLSHLSEEEEMDVGGGASLNLSSVTNNKSINNKEDSRLSSSTSGRKLSSSDDNLLPSPKVSCHSPSEIKKSSSSLNTSDMDLSSDLPHKDSLVLRRSKSSCVRSRPVSAIPIYPSPESSTDESLNSNSSILSIKDITSPNSFAERNKLNNSSLESNSLILGHSKTSSLSSTSLVKKSLLSDFSDDLKNKLSDTSSSLTSISSFKSRTCTPNPLQASSPVVTSNLTNKNPQLLARSKSLRERLQRNCESAAHRVSEPIISLNPSTNTTRAITRSFVPPSRDDESETQRKAHAKMVRSTRRSTQGVSLEDIKSAEQLMKNKPPPPPTTTPVITSSQENSFSLEDARLKENKETKKVEEASNDSETPTVTIQIRKKNNAEEKKEEEDGEKKSQTREGTQAAIQRKRKPKRRSTGVVHVDMDEIDPERRALKEAERNQQEVEDDNDDTEDLSTSDKDVTKGSSTSVNSTSRHSSRSSSVATENGDIDYKKLYLEQLEVNNKLQERLKVFEKEMKQSRETIENNAKTTMMRQAQSESEKREKRALERKLSEMEEELRAQEQLKQENQRLRDENGALIRVISKLSK